MSGTRSRCLTSTSSSSAPDSRASGPAVTLQRECPWASYAIFEARDAIGGTWDLFRYPGIRSDSDMHTLGYSFRPWDGEKSIADGDSIRQYIKDTAAESGVDRRIRFNHRVIAADWSSDDARWHVTAERTDTGETLRPDGRVPFLLQRLLPLRPRLPARLRRHGRLRRAPWCTPKPGRRTSTYTGKRDRRHRQRRDRSDAGARAGPLGRPRDDAAAVPELHRVDCPKSPAAALFRVAAAGQDGGHGHQVVPRADDAGLLPGVPALPRADAAAC